MTPQQLDDKIKRIEDELILAAFHGNKLEWAEDKLIELYKIRDGWK